MDEALAWAAKAAIAELIIRYAALSDAARLGRTHAAYTPRMVA